MKNNKKSPIVIVLYTLSILIGIYTIFTVYSSYTYISSLVEQGLVISDELQNVINYYVDASLPSLFYAIAIWGIGYIINKLNYITNEVKSNNQENIIKETIVTESNEDVKEDIIITESTEDTKEEI